MTTFHRPASLSAALDVMADHGADADLIAGGTALMLPPRRQQPRRHLVALFDVDDLHGMHLTNGGGLRIGALTSHASIAASATVQDFCPALASAFRKIATTRVRNQATIGGNLAMANPAHDPPAILMALDARVQLVRRDGRREVAVDDLALEGFTSAILPDEVLLEVRIPPLTGQRVAHTKFIMRAGSLRDQAGYPTVSCGVALRLDDEGRCARAAIGLAGVHRGPVRGRVAERVLTGRTITPGVIRDAAWQQAAVLDPVDDERGSPPYKRAMAAVWLERTLTQALARPPLAQASNRP